MRFWDSSALVPLLLGQPLTRRARALHREDRDLVVWWSARVECASAIGRLERDGDLSADAAADARRNLTRLAASWFEIQPGDALREQALRLLRIHALRAADALQLAAALDWSGTPPAVAGATIVVFDTRLGAAGSREGFEVLGGD